MSDELLPEMAEAQETERRRTEGRLVQALRREAYDVRDCFTRFSFQSLTASGALFILILKFQSDAHENYYLFGLVHESHYLVWLGLASVIPALLLIAVSHMGLHKYGTSNRLMGFELYLDKVQHYTYEDSFHPRMRDVGWEEAMRAWRVVNHTLILAMYRDPSYLDRALVESWKDRINRLYSMARYEFWGMAPASDLPEWCSPMRTTREEGASYSSGGYLRAILTAVFLLLAIELFDACVSGSWIASQLEIPRYRQIAVASLLLLPPILCGLRMIHIWSRLKVLESEISSIHSASIIWEATILAHLKVLRQMGLLGLFVGASREPPHNYKGYTRQLAKVALELAKRRQNIHAVISEWRHEIYFALAARHPRARG